MYIIKIYNINHKSSIKIIKNLEKKYMVKSEWMENKILKLENDRNNNYWTEVRENQLQFLIDVYKTGSYEKYSEEDINNKLVIIFNYY
jgi:hypothetical protein